MLEDKNLGEIWGRKWQKSLRLDQLKWKREEKFEKLLK